MPGKIIQFKKSTGDSVSFGDVICTIDAVVATNNSENAALNLELIQNKLFGRASVIQDIEQEINVAEEQYAVDANQLERYEKMRDRQLASESELEQFRLRATASKARMEGLISQKKRLEQELKIQQKQAKNAYESALSTSSSASITSLVDGMIYEIFKENGELVNVQQPIAMIGSQSDYIIRLLIDEVDIVRVAIGQPVLVQLEAYPDETFSARVRQIYPKMDPKTQSFEVLAVFDTPPSKLYLGLTGEANIVVEERDDVIVIPREYLVEDAFVETADGRKKIRIGLKSLSHVEVLEGLQAGELIYLPEE
jgi:multidrug resistance efflux pump